MTLEREIYSIETANINKETLEAMKNASKAMKDIHGGLTIEKVDQTMYVRLNMFCFMETNHNHGTGKNFEINMLLSRKLARRLHRLLLDKVSMKQSWMRNSRLCSKKN